MALVLKYEVDTETATQAVIEDTTGTYGAENLGGFSAPNPDRGSSYMGLCVTYKKSDEDVPLTVEITTPTSGTPLTVSKWTVTLEGAGYHKISQFIAPLYDTGIAYNQYDIIYDTTSELFYYWGEVTVSVAGAFLVSNGWIELVDAEIVDLSTQDSDDGFYKNIDNQFFTVSIDVAFTEASLEFTKADKCDATNKCLLGFKIFSYKVSAQALSATGNYIRGQEIIEAVENIISSSSTDCSC